MLLGLGSSPLARGLRRRPPPRDHDRGIIPARAGFTPGSQGRQGGLKDHPRSRGVYGVNRERKREMNGSSPLARGLRRTVVGRGPPPRIIPARAGFTTRPGTGASSSADHPRSRGVYRALTFARDSSLGSSPLARGLLGLPEPEEGVVRIIPARAGFTSMTGLPVVACTDHPRSRGVYGRWALARAGPLGSSPLARGLRLLGIPWSLARGIIPARAGFTGGQHPEVGDVADHPRSRGVYQFPQMSMEPHLGSSPLARGLPQLVVLGGPLDRIIPARAGFTLTAG